MSARKSEKPIPSSMGERKNVSSDTFVDLDQDKLAKIKEQFGDKENAKFRLNFYNTQDAKPKIAATKSTGSDSYEILVYNLPYDNPIILTYQNKLYLKTGINYYEIDPAISGKQDAKPVTDAAILKVLNQ
jgi:hypothetical protein